MCVCVCVCDEIDVITENDKGSLTTRPKAFLRPSTDVHEEVASHSVPARDETMITFQNTLFRVLKKQTQFIWLFNDENTVIGSYVLPGPK